MNYQSLVEFQYWTVIGQICNLLLQMYLFKRFLFKPIKNILMQRQNEVDNTYQEAAQAKEDAETAKAEYESHLLQARVEAEAITSRAVETAKHQSAAMVKAAEAETAALREKAARDIELERRKVMAEAKGEISSLAVEIASKVVKKEIDQKDHEALFEQFIDELGEKL